MSNHWGYVGLEKPEQAQEIVTAGMWGDSS